MSYLIPAAKLLSGTYTPTLTNVANLGAAFASAIAAQGAAILGDATNNRAQMQWVAGDITNQSMFFTFSYEVI